MANQGNQSGSQSGSGSESGSQREASGSGGGSRQGGQGFAGMSEEEQRKIGQKGGEAVSKDRDHMSEIGRKAAKPAEKTALASSPHRIPSSET